MGLADELANMGNMTILAPHHSFPGLHIVHVFHFWQVSTHTRAPDIMPNLYVRDVNSGKQK